MTTASGESDATTSARPETPRDGQRHDARAGAAAEQLERPHRERVGIELVAGRVADEDREAADGRRGEALRAAQPAVGPARREGPGGAVGAEARAELLERGQQHLLDRALHGAQRERRLHRAVGAVELEAGERADERVGVGAERLARAADRRRDRQPLLERVAQRGDLPVRVQAMLAGRALGLGVAEAALPGAKRVRADVQQRRRLARLQSPHVRDIIRRWPEPMQT